LYIQNIDIKNFRTFIDLNLQLNAGLNVIVGENNSGKTALVDAIRLTLDTTSSEWTRISATDFHGDEKHFHIQLKFLDITPEQASVFVEHLTHEDDGNGTKQFALYVSLKADITDIFKRGNQYIRTELRSGAAAEGPIIEREIRDYLSATYLKPLRDAEAELNAGRNSRLSQILSSSKQFKRTDGGAFQGLIDKFVQASADILQNEGLAKDRADIDANLQNLIFEQDKFGLAIQMLGSKAFDQMSSSEKERAFQEIIQKLSLVLDENKPLQGLGYNNVLFMATELLLLEQEMNEFPLLLIEEPEAHLHPQLQMKFLSFIRDEYSEQKKPKLQTIITTHSPNLASKAPLENIILMKEAKAFPMQKGKTELAPDDYVFLEKFLDVTKSNLFFAKGILIVEGDAENILLPTLAQLIGRPLEDYGISVVNVGSTAFARFAKIFIRKSDEDENQPESQLDIPVACLRDLDLWPAKADKAHQSGLGWKEKKQPDANGRGGNLQYWVSRENFKNRKEALNELSCQNVLVCVSNKWTFEYSLIRSGLDELIWEIVDTGEVLRDNKEERAIQIYKEIETKSGAKTDVAYKLAVKLQECYEPTKKADRDELLGKLPAYIKDAFKHVMGLPNLEKDDPQSNDKAQQGHAEVAGDAA